MRLALRLGAMLALTFTSCALFAYGTGRFNPIRATLESAFTVSSNSTNFVALSLPASEVSKVMPAPVQLYAPENLVKPFDRRTVALRDARWQSASAPSGWGWNLERATLELRIWQRLGQVWERRAEVYSDLEADNGAIYVFLSVPSNAPQGSYNLRATVQLGSFSGVTLDITANVSNQAPASGSIATRANGILNVQPGAAYRLEVPLSGADVQRLSGLASLSLQLGSERLNNRARVRGDEWRVANASLPNRWELEWLEGNLAVDIIGSVSIVGPNRLRTEYSLSYTDLQLVLGLRAIAAAPGVYGVTGQLEYRAVPVNALRWTVTVKP